MRVFETILCPVDFSPDSARALQWAEHLAKRYDSNLMAMHMLEYPGATDAFAYDYDAIHARVVADLNDFVAPITVKHEALVVTGSAGPEILEQASSRGATLIVMGTHGRTGAAHAILGSTTEFVVRNSEVPVFTISPNCPSPAEFHEQERALIPLSSLDHPPRTFVSIRRMLRELKLRPALLNVVPFSDPMFGVNYSVHPFNVTAYETDEKAKQLLGVSARIVPEDCEPETLIRFGDAGEEILRETNNGQYSVLLMSVGKGRLLTGFMNSTAHKVMSRCSIPVITVSAV